MYKKVELKNGFVGMENEVAEMWKQKNIIKKNFEMNKGQRYFTFYDGPPPNGGFYCVQPPGNPFCLYIRLYISC